MANAAIKEKGTRRQRCEHNQSGAGTDGRVSPRYRCAQAQWHQRRSMACREFPITDLGRMAQAAGMRVISFRHEQNAGNAAAIAGFLTKKPGICLTVSAPGLSQWPDGAGQCHDQLLSDDPDQRLVRARDRRLAAGRLRRDGPAGDRQAALQGGVSACSTPPTSASAWRARYAPPFPVVRAASISICRPSFSRK